MAILKENDFVLLNGYETHTINRVSEDNICFARQFDLVGSRSFEKLFSCLKLYGANIENKIDKEEIPHVVKLKVAINQDGTHLDLYWKMLTSISTAADNDENDSYNWNFIDDLFDFLRDVNLAQGFWDNIIYNNVLDYEPEIHITEWHASALSRNLINVATYIDKSVLNALGAVDSLG
ncbi:MAG: hypothetical protein GX778_06670 [Erysipelothrix sp.]|nr:hypothetical protein [Erysipelothrix sp.]